nr:hypothetical protein [Tanacetum cinerariifolium]GFA89186.1 hypothetical protein [Tanacetum cinerariifolium]
STMQDLQAHALKQEEASATCTKSSTNMAWNLGSRMTSVEISQTALKREVSSPRGEMKKAAKETKLLAMSRPEVIKKNPEELGIQSALLASFLEQVSSQTSGRKRKHMELEPKIKVPRLEYVFGDQAFQRWDDIHKVRIDPLVSYLVIALMVKTEENSQFSLKLRKLIADHPDQEKLKSKKVKQEAL